MAYIASTSGRASVTPYRHKHLYCTPLAIGEFDFGMDRPTPKALIFLTIHGHYRNDQTLALSHPFGTVHRYLFAGSVYPREVVKTSLRLNAAAVIFAHNHPSGVPEPSRADENLTRVLKDALALVDVRVLDHVVVAGGASVSFAQRGLL